jgi:hypothetical protein
MRRVHNDGGSVSPPPSGHSRGKKRKNDEKLEHQPTEKAIKRVSTPPVVVHQPQEPSSEEIYQREYQRLLALVEQIRDPKDVRNLDKLQNTMECLKSLHRTSNDIAGGRFSRQQARAQQSG